MTSSAETLPEVRTIGLPPQIIPGQPLTVLAPMQDVTTHAFMHVVADFGPPDYFVTEFFRVHDTSRPEKHILHSIDDNRTGRPIFAQLIGESLIHLERTVAELAQHPIAGIDLNLGCPAPKVYKKNVGGGLLRDPARVDKILRTLRNACPGLFTVKMRIGFDDCSPFHAVLNSIANHGVDLLSVHGRTVKEGYRSEVHYDLIKEAVERVPCPVLANGNITSARSAIRVIEDTGAAGVMMGRHAIRNPWIFAQCRKAFAGNTVDRINLSQVYDYIARLFEAITTPGIPEIARVNRMKKFLNFVGQGVDGDGVFLYEMRRTRSADELFDVCRRHLLSRPEDLFADEPYPGVIARPNCETPLD
jgi:tRNA-dihydrouridine synthase B